ncbi:MAG: DUF5685 family protein [Eubacteriales bacterium]|nr:DUF5685 family protein [Eubacteriales bacterium]
MFGYIRPLECELKVREQAEYRGYYCGLCKTIGARYGPLERLTLSYDCAFLAALLSAISGGGGFTRGNCGPRCYRGKRPIANRSDALDYAADVNVLLAWYQAADDVADEKSAKALAARAALRRAYRKAAKLHPALDDAIRRNMERLKAYEAERIASTDEPSDAFGKTLSAVILNAPTLPERERAAADWMFYNLGKWVYLMDAWDDREKDEKSGSYNPFLLTNMDAQRAEFYLNITRAEAEKGFDLIGFSKPDGLIENIIRLGLGNAQTRVLTGLGGCKTANAAPHSEKGDGE